MRRRHLRALASAAFGGRVQTKVHFSTSNKVIVGASALISAIHTTDFIFYGQEIRNLLGAAGFAMLERSEAKINSLTLQGGRSIIICDAAWPQRVWY
jgi:hypothetical protein